MNASIKNEKFLMEKSQTCGTLIANENSKHFFVPYYRTSIRTFAILLLK